MDAGENKQVLIDIKVIFFKKWWLKVVEQMTDAYASNIPPGLDINHCPTAPGRLDLVSGNLILTETPLLPARRGKWFF